ncbi:hypothetical protein JHD49_07235, partial [Sulfurimonas sp. SAG-AH-194-C21]
MINTVLIPWNMSYYIPLGSFVHKYKSILSYKGAKRIIVPKHSYMYREYHHLKKANVYNGEIDDDLWWLKNLDTSLQKKYYTFFSKRDINFTSYLPGDIEFLHTAPVTKGERAFLIYVEDFLTFFTPFVEHIEEENSSIRAKIRESYKLLLLKNCIGIISHNKNTLTLLSSFFNDKTIDKLLIYRPLQATSIEGKPISNTKTIYTFTPTKGNDILLAIKEALNVLQKSDKCKVQVIFQVKRPTQTVLQTGKFDMDLLKELENTGTIIWIETLLSSVATDKLLAKSNYFLSPNIVQNDNIIRYKIDFNYLFNHSILNTLHLTTKTYQESKLLLGESYIEDIDIKWFNTTNSVKKLFYTGFGYAIKIFNTYLFISSKNMHTINTNILTSHISRAEQKYLPLDERVYEVFSNPCQIMPYLHRVVDQDNANSYYMSRR